MPRGSSYMSWLQERASVLSQSPAQRSLWEDASENIFLQTHVRVKSCLITTLPAARGESSQSLNSTEDKPAVSREKIWRMKALPNELLTYF
jgi:hypothetical protein